MLPHFLGGNQIDAKMYGQFCGISLIHSALFGLQLPLQLYTLFAEFLGWPCFHHSHQWASWMANPARAIIRVTV